jgi:hypothetical protein
MIVCLRTVAVPTEKRDDYLAWIRDGRPVREAHGILASSCSRRHQTTATPS